jgi:hypothetical protein
MNRGRMIFAPVMEHAPHALFQRCMRQYPSRYRVRRFSAWDQYLAMAFAQLSFRGSLRGIEACLRAMLDKLYHMGIRAPRVARSTLAEANERRDWRIFAEFAQLLIAGYGLHEGWHLVNGGGEPEEPFWEQTCLKQPGVILLSTSRLL